MRSFLSTVYSPEYFHFQGWQTYTSLRPFIQLPLTREKCRLWLIEYEYEQIKESSHSPGINGGVPRSHPWSPHRLRNEERSQAQDDDRACGSIFHLHGNDDVRYYGSVRAWWRQCLTDGGLVISPREYDRRAESFRKMLAMPPDAGTNTILIT